MGGTADKALLGAAGHDPAGPVLSAADKPGAPAERAGCFHCGEPCPDETFSKAGKRFCCQGCLVVHDLLAESGLEQFYDLSRHPGVRVQSGARRERWAYLDEPGMRQRLLDFTDGKLSRVTFQVPAIHCVACVWLLENLFRLHPGIGRSQVNFPRREVAISFAAGKIALSELVALLASIGYEPRLTLGELARPEADPARKRRWLQVGIAGFAFGNIMLFSLPLYLGLDSFSGPLFRKVFGCLSLTLAAPVVVYSAADYWRAALLSVRQRVLTLDVPIVLGLAALYAQSAFEIVSGRGEGYLDSLAGLVFLLLCGRAFQQKTHDRIAFDRDYKCFFPLAVMRQTRTGEESVALSDLRIGDRLHLRHSELIPTDAVLLRGPALIDYSFVTGESQPVPKQPGDYLYAGGRQMGGAVEIETVKPVSQSYLTSLWNHAAFQKKRDDGFDSLTNRYSRRFTWIVVGIALAAAAFWLLRGDGARGLKAFTSVLIVACPCALALAAPFTLGTAQRLLARRQIFLKNAHVLERLAQVDAIVFDKTGTLTCAAETEVRFFGGERVPIVSRGPELRIPLTPALSPGEREIPSPVFEDRKAPQLSLSRAIVLPLPTGEVRGERNHASEIPPLTTPESSECGATSGGTLDESEASWVASLARHSTHPHSARIGECLAGHKSEAVEGFVEVPGRGIAGTVRGHAVRLGSRAWLEAGAVPLPDLALPAGSAVYLSIDGLFRGVFVLAGALRPAAEQLLANLGGQFEIALLSGDNEKERERFRALFGAGARLHFNQSPLDKLGFIRELQKADKKVMMVGDGLNDAGALQQSDVGVAVVEKVGAFSPASDVILAATQVPHLCKVLALARRSANIVRVSFGVSALYNVAGISIAAAGVFSPLICAILMPVSSISVVVLACGATQWAARRIGLGEENSVEAPR